MSFNSNGIKIKKENYKALKEEIKNIKYNINEEMYNAGVFMNENEEYIWRAKKKKIYQKSSPEKRFDINEILKYYELNKDKYLQGFTSKYFRQLTDLLTKNMHKKYPKERMDLFNSRINKSQKIYCKVLKKGEEDADINSSINKKINNPFVTTLYPYKGNKNNNMKVNKKLKNNMSFSNYGNIHKVFSLNNILTLPYNNCDKTISKYNNKNKMNDISTDRENENNSKININQNKNTILSKYHSYKNILSNKKNNNMNFENKSFSFGNNKNNNSVRLNRVESKDEFFNHLDQGKYIYFLKKQYNFFNEYNDKSKQNFESETKRRKDMFNSKPNSKFLDKIIKDTSKLDFFNKIKRKIKNENSPPSFNLNKTNKIVIKKKGKEVSFLTSRFLKTMKFNNDCQSIYDKYKNNIK